MIGIRFDPENPTRDEVLAVYCQNLRAQCGDPEADELSVQFAVECPDARLEFMVGNVEELDGRLVIHGEVLFWPISPEVESSWQDAVVTGYDPVTRSGGSIELCRLWW